MSAPTQAMAAAGATAPGAALHHGRRGVGAFIGRLIAYPLALFIGPIFQKEMAVAGRRASTYWVRSLYTLGLLAAFAVAFLSRARWNEEPDRISAAALEASSGIARGLAVSMVWLQFPLLSLIAAQLCAGAICEERTNRTLGTLITAPLSGLQIIIGKLTSRMMQVVILLAIAAPVLLLLRVYGGFDANAVLAGVACALAGACLTGSIAVMYSIWHRRTWTAVLMTLISMATVYMFPFGLVLSWTGGSPSGTSMMELGLRFVSLPYALALATFVDEIAVADPSARFAWMVAAPVNLVLALGVCLWSAAALRRVMLAEAAGWVPGRGSMLPWLGRGKKSRAVGAAAPEVAAKPSPRRVSTEVLGNPVAWRERRTPLLGSRRVTVAVMVPVGLALAYLYWVGEGRDPALHGFIVLACLSLQMIAAAMLTTSAVASERDGRTLDVLLTTPMTGRAVVLGKLAGCGVRLAVLPVFATLHLLVFILTGDIRWPALVIIPAVIIGHAMLLAGTGLYFGVRCRRGVMASVLNVVLALMLWVAAPLVFGAVRFAVETRRYHPDDTVGPGYLDYIDDVTSALLAAHPFFATVITLEQTEHEGMRRDRWGESFTAWQFGSCAVGSAALAAGIGGFAALRAGKRLERLRGNWR